MCNFCGTRLRQPTQEERDIIRIRMKFNPQRLNESDEDYIIRLMELG